MISSRNITKIVAVIMTAAVLLCGLAIVFQSRLAEPLGGRGVAMAYETALFGTDTPIQINIRMDESDWEAMLANALAEEYQSCDVEINGTTFYQVAIRPKGNTSLSSIAMDPTTNRFSFKLEFDHYVKGQTCFGLDKLVLNNNYADATNMKEALVYDMFSYLDADASLSNYAEISVNGEYWGIYLALEGVEDSFLLRNYGVDTGKLYKPETMGGGQRDFGDRSQNEDDPFGGSRRERSAERGQNPFSQIQSLLADADQDALKNVLTEAGFDALADAVGSTDTLVLVNALNGVDTDRLKAALEAGGFGDLAEQLGSFSAPGEGGPGGGFSFMRGGGANLNYTDDSLDSYSTIWEGAVSKVKKSDEERVVTALKHASEGTELETYMDVDNLLKYMAVHIFAVNADSLSGSMSHNYYLYEYNGQLNLLPWDYNLSFGGMGGMGGGPGRAVSEGATGTVNSPIDDAWNGTNFFDKLLENEDYAARYHEYMRQLVEGYIEGGKFDEFYQNTRNQISDLVATDPNAFYTAEEYEAAVQTLYEIVTLRGQSVSGQLDGSIPSTDAGQMQDPSALVDASHLDTSVMGTMNMGGGRGGPGGDFGPFGNAESGNPFGGQMPDGFGTSSGNSAVQPTETTLPPTMPQEGQAPAGMQPPDGYAPSSGAPAAQPGAAGMPQNGQAPTDLQPPQGFDPNQAAGGFPGSSGNSSSPTGQMPESTPQATGEAAPAAPQGGQPPAGMQMPDGFAPSSGESSAPAIPETTLAQSTEETAAPATERDSAAQRHPDFPADKTPQPSSDSSNSGLFLLAVSILFLAVGLVFVCLFRQNTKKR